jgi:hypothetical protein
MRVRVVPIHNHSPLTVRNSPGGREIGRVPMGATGTIVDHPRNGETAYARGEEHSWVCVDFDSGPTGFVAEEHLRGGGASRGGGGGGGGCFITSATCRALGEPDDGLTLTALRALRDGSMRTSETGRALVEAYYAEAPALVDWLEAQPDADVLFTQLAREYLRPAVRSVLRGAPDDAVDRYVAMMHFLRARSRG